MTPTQESVVVFSLATFVYLGVSKAPFLHDDIPAVVRNKDVQGSSSLVEIWQNDFWGTPIVQNTSHKSFRPLSVLTFRVLHNLVGNWSPAYHVINILLHALVSTMFLQVCRRIVFTKRDDCKTPLVAGVLFAIHPIHTEAVCGVVGMAELLSAFFFMLVLLIQNANTSPQNTKCNSGLIHLKDDVKPLKVGSADRTKGLRFRGPAKDVAVACKNSTTLTHDVTNTSHPGDESLIRLSLVLAFSFCAMISKESGLTVLGVVAALKVIRFLERSGYQGQRDVINFLVRIFCLVVWTLVFLFWRLWMMDFTQPTFAEADNRASKSPHFMTRTMTYSWICFVNFGLLCFPFPLCYDWSYDTIPLVTSLWDIRNLAPIALLLVLLGGCLLVVTKRREYASLFRPLLTAHALLIISFLPASNLFFPVGFVIAERTLYLPSTGFVCFTALTWQKGCEKFPSMKKMINFVLVLVILLFSFRTITRCQDWTSNEAFMRSGVLSNPGNAKTRYNWANHLYNSNLTREAASEYEKVLELWPDYVGAMNNLATILQDDPKTRGRSEQLYIRIIQIQPWHANAYNNLANILQSQKKFDEAAQVLVRGLGQAGAKKATAVQLARTLAANRKFGPAARIYHVLLNHSCVTDLSDVGMTSCVGVNASQMSEYAKMMQDSGNTSIALKLFRRSIAINPNNGETRALFAGALFNNNRADEAVQEMLRSVELDQAQFHRLWSLASDLFQQGSFAKSVVLYERAIKIRPENQQLLGHYAAVLHEMGDRKQALALLVDLTEKDRDCKFDQTWRNLAVLYAKQGRYVKGIDLLESCASRIERFSAVAERQNSLRLAGVRTLLAKHLKLQAYRYKESRDPEAARQAWTRSIDNLERAVSLDPSLGDAREQLGAMRDSQS